MIEAFKIGVLLSMEGDAPAGVEKLSANMRVLDDVLKRVQGNLDQLRTGMSGLDKAGQSAAGAWERAAMAMERAASAATRAGAAAASVMRQPLMPGYQPQRTIDGDAEVIPPQRRALPAPFPLIPYEPPEERGGVPAVIPNTGRYGGPMFGPFGHPGTQAPGAGGFANWYAGPAGGPPIGMRVPPGGVPWLPSAAPGAPGGPGSPPPAGVPGGAAGGAGGHGGGLLSGMGGWIEEGAEVLSARNAMEEDLALRQTLLYLGYKSGSGEFDRAMEQLRRLAESGTAGTIYSQVAGSLAMPGAAAVLGFGGSTPADRAKALKEFAAIYPEALRLGEVAEMQHLGDLNESITAAIAYAHLTDRYTPAQLGPGLDRLLNVARLTHTTVPAEERVLKYSAPIAQAAGMKADDAAALTGFLQVLGFSGTTAGTGLGQLITGLKSSALQRLDSEHAKAMMALGIIDRHGHMAGDVAPGGKLDAMALLRHIADYAQAHKPMDVLGVLRNAFTVRGMRVAGTLESPDAIPRLERYIDQLTRLPGATATQAALAVSPMQEFQQMLARLNDLGNALASGTLPTLKTAFEGATAAITGLTKLLNSMPALRNAIGYTGEAAGAGLLFMSGHAMARRLGLLAPAAGGAAGAGSIMRVARGAGAIGLGVLEGEALTGISDWTTKKFDDLIFGKGSYDKDVEFNREMSGKFWSEVKHWLIPGASAATPNHPVPVRVVHDATQKPTVLPPTTGNGTPVVHVAGGRISIDNPGDIKHGVTSGIIHDAHGPQTGPTGVDVRIDPFGAGFQAGLP